jgi:ABC-type transport system substrate-binding protein
MKRIFAMLLVFALVFALVACGGTDETTTQNTSTTTEPTDNSDSSSGTDSQPASGTPDGATGLGDAGQSDDAATHEYTEITIGSTASKFVGHFEATGGYSTDTSCSSRTLVFDHAFEVDPDTRVWYSNILDNPTFDNDTCLATLPVKEGVVFNRNHEQLLASDLLYSFKSNATSPRTAGNWAKYVDFDRSYVSDDNMTLYVQFNMPLGTWEYQLSQPGILDESWIEENGGFDNFDWFDIDLVNGTGPYIPTEFTIGVSTTYERVEDWWGSDLFTTSYCYADKIICLQYSDETTMMVDYENGVIDMALSLSSTSFDRVVADPSLGTAQSTSSGCVADIAMNYDVVDSNPLLDNIDLRKAICYGTPADDLGELAYGSLYSKAESVIPSSLPFAATGYSYEYDPDLAQSYMDESGLAGSTLIWVANSGTSAATIAEAFQAYMAELDLNIDVQIYDTLTCISLWETANATDFQLCNNNNANTTGDASELVRNFGNSTSFYCSNRMGDEINSLIDSVLYTTIESERAEGFAAIQEYIYNEYSIIPLCEWNVALAYNDKIASTRLTDVYQPDLRYIGF